MNTVKIIGQVDDNHRLTAEMPARVPPGRIEIIVLLDRDALDEEESSWQAGISRAWAEDWDDPREDLYTLADGEPVNVAR